MIIKETTLQGVYEIENKVFEDKRGHFIKTFHNEQFKIKGLEYNFKESYYSKSKRGVLRGMHYQKPPHDHAKLIYVTRGEILDVALDIRMNSPTYGMCYSTILSDENNKSIYLSKGFAHGFLTLSKSATVVYMTTSIHSPESDSGISWDSFGYEWGITNPIMSERDKNFLSLKS